MAIGLGTMLAIGAISAAGSGTKAVIQSKAAKKAAKQQVQGTQDASRYVQQGLGQIGQLYSPYVNAGASAQNTLSRLRTPGAGARFASPGPPSGMPQAPTGNTAMPRGATGMPPGYGGPTSYGPPQGGRQMQGPYMMAEGGDMVVDKPTMFIAGEAGPERATFSGGPMAQGPMPRPMMGGGGAMGGPIGAAMRRPDLRTALLGKYGAGGGIRGPQVPGMGQGMGPRPMMGSAGMVGQPGMPPGAGGTFARMMPPRPMPPQMARQMPPQMPGPPPQGPPPQAAPGFQY